MFGRLSNVDHTIISLDWPALLVLHRLVKYTWTKETFSVTGLDMREDQAILAVPLPSREESINGLGIVSLPLISKHLFRTHKRTRTLRPSQRAW